MLKFIGAIMIVAAASSVGIGATLRLKERERSIASVISMLMTMENEICERLLPMPELLEMLAKNSTAPAKYLAASCFEKMKSIGVMSFCDIWRSSVRDTRLELSSDESMCLMELGQSLGRYDTGRQKKAISAVIRRFEGFLHSAEEERRRQGKVYTALGVTAGLFVVIVLL